MGVVVGKMTVGRAAHRPASLQAVRTTVGACRAGYTVNAVRIRGQGVNPFRAVKGEGEGQQELRCDRPGPARVP